MERERQAALEEPLRDALQAYSKVAGTNAPVPMQANASVVAIQRDAQKPKVSTMDTSEQSTHSEIKVV